MNLYEEDRVQSVADIRYITWGRRVVSHNTTDLALDTKHHPERFRKLRISVDCAGNFKAFEEIVQYIRTSSKLRKLHFLMNVDDWYFLNGVLEAIIENENIKSIFLEKCVLRNYKVAANLLEAKDNVSLDHCKLPHTQTKNISKLLCGAIQKNRTLKVVRIVDTLGPHVQIQLLNALRSCPMVYRLGISVQTEEMANALASFLARTQGAHRSKFLILTLYDSIFERDTCAALLHAMVDSQMEIILVFKQCQWPGKGGDITQLGFFRALRRNLRVNIIIGPGNNMSEDHAGQLMEHQNEGREVQLYHQSREYTINGVIKNKCAEIHPYYVHDTIVDAFFSDDAPLNSFFEFMAMNFNTQYTQDVSEASHGANPVVRTRRGR